MTAQEMWENGVPGGLLDPGRKHGCWRFVTCCGIHFDEAVPKNLNEPAESQATHPSATWNFEKQYMKTTEAFYVSCFRVWSWTVAT